MFDRIEFPEIFIGIVAPVGVEIDTTVNAFSEYFRNNNYDVINIRITEHFKQLKHLLRKNIKISDLKLLSASTEQKIKSYINAGNTFREVYNDNSILAAFSIFKIQEKRASFSPTPGDVTFQKKVYIIRQFKRKEEIDLLRSVYGRLFFQISIHADKTYRINHLAKRIAHEENQQSVDKYLGRAADLVNMDENQSEVKYGQRLAKIFHEADFIVKRDKKDDNECRDQVRRFCELLFSSNTISPTKMEYGMFAAKAAALRTLDLSRQVGAAIFRKTGEIICLGSNEVPKGGGGTYWCDDTTLDAREFTKKQDSNDARKKELLKELFEASGLSGTFEEFISKPEIRDSQFMDALEYGRIVHAEMSALMDAARTGNSVKDAMLFCTTFPCHMCAKHIVASGIDNVIYLEPYPKSLAFDLHVDSIELDGMHRIGYEKNKAVKLEHFYGITPRRYREFFERNSRKHDGALEDYVEGKKRPNIDYKFPFYSELERVIIEKGLKETEKIANG